eukprot:362910_1
MMVICIFVITLYLYQSFAKQIEYDINYDCDSKTYQELCGNVKAPQPRAFESESDVKEWYSKFRMCYMGWFNEETDDSISYGFVIDDVIDDESETCVYDKKDKDEFDCYSMSSLPNLANYIKYLIDFQEFHFNIREFTNSSFTVYGEASGVVEVKGIGFGGGLVKNNEFEEMFTFKFDDNGNGIIKKMYRLDDGGLYKKVLRWSKSKAASAVSNSFSSISKNIDYFNENNDYFQINKTIAVIITFLVIISSILIGILFGICVMSRCLFHNIIAQSSGSESEVIPDSEKIALNNN